MDFDFRANTIATKIEAHWDDKVKALWQENHQRSIDGLRQQFGERNLDAKVQDFIDMGAKPFSIVAYHNALFEQVRIAFVAGAHYPAVTGACALGERILNHLGLDLREDFRSTPEYKRVYRKSSFDNWELAIDVLVAWSVLLPDVADEFRKLGALRNRTIHFNAKTYSTLRSDALMAITHMRVIIEGQFGIFGAQPWIIEGTRGAAFIKREYETRPFVKRYFLPQCPFVGVRCALEHGPQGFIHVDFNDYGPGELTDQEFCQAFNDRDPRSIARSTPSEP